MAFPPAHLLVGAGAAEVVRSVAPLPRGRAWGVAAALALVPDLDFVLGILAGRASQYHGTFTHSVVATLAVGLAARLLAGRRWGALAAVGYGSHLLVDLLDDRGRTNVLLGWPFTDAQPFAIAKLFPIVPFEQGEGIRVAFLSLFRPEVFARLAAQTLLGAAVFAALLLLAALLRRARRAA